MNEEAEIIYEMLDLKFGACRLCLAGKENGLNKPVSKTLIVATKYINTAKKLFQEREINVELIKLNGSVELGPIVGLSDIILDIVESGKTLKENNLLNTLDGILIMEQVSGGGREFIAGINSDANYGHQLMFGIGGIFVESLKEVAFRPCPLSLFDAQELINATKAKNLLKSVRGKPAVNEQQVIESFLRLSKLVETFPNIKELDINPFMIDEKGNLVCVDARIVF